MTAIWCPFDNERFRLLDALRRERLAAKQRARATAGYAFEDGQMLPRCGQVTRGRENAAQESK